MEASLAAPPPQGQGPTSVTFQIHTGSEGRVARVVKRSPHCRKQDLEAILGFKDRGRRKQQPPSSDVDPTTQVRWREEGIM